MDTVLSLGLSRYQIGLAAQAVRERLHAYNDGRISLDDSERDDLYVLLDVFQEACISDKREAV